MLMRIWGHWFSERMMIQRQKSLAIIKSGITTLRRGKNNENSQTTPTSVQQIQMLRLSPEQVVIENFATKGITPVMQNQESLRIAMSQPVPGMKASS